MSRTLLTVGQLWPFVLTAASFSHKLFDNRKALVLTYVRKDVMDVLNSPEFTPRVF